MRIVNQQRLAVEYDRRTVGIAVREAGGFFFYASDPRFEAMEGRPFPRTRAIRRELRKLARRGKGFGFPKILRRDKSGATAAEPAEARQ